MDSVSFFKFIFGAFLILAYVPVVQNARSSGSRSGSRSSYRSNYYSSRYYASRRSTRYYITNYYRSYAYWPTSYFAMYLYYKDGAYSNRRTGNSYTVCKNYQPYNLSGTLVTLGAFTCPRPFEPSNFVYCCGESNEEYCCDLSYKGGILAGIAIACIAGVIIIVVAIHCIKKKTSCKKRPGRTRIAPSWQGNPMPPPVWNQNQSVGYTNGTLNPPPYPDNVWNQNQSVGYPNGTLPPYPDNGKSHTPPPPYPGPGSAAVYPPTGGEMNPPPAYAPVTASGYPT